MKEVAIQLDSDLYPIEVIESALYRNAERFVGKIDKNPNTEKPSFVITLSVRSTVTDLTENELREFFLISLNDESLRLKVDQQTEKLRCIILAHAFSKAGLSDE